MTRNSLSSFGFQSRAAQLTYPFMIFGMLLVHRYVYPAHPELETVEFTASLAALPRAEVSLIESRAKSPVRAVRGTPGRTSLSSLHPVSKPPTPPAVDRW